MPSEARHGSRRSWVGWSAGRTSRSMRQWNGRHYRQKQVRPIFDDEPERIVVVTVYVYHF